MLYVAIWYVSIRPVVMRVKEERRRRSQVLLEMSNFRFTFRNGLYTSSRIVKSIYPCTCRASYYNVCRLTNKDAQIVTNILYFTVLTGSTCFGRTTRPSSGALSSKTVSRSSYIRAGESSYYMAVAT